MNRGDLLEALIAAGLRPEQSSRHIRILLDHRLQRLSRFPTEEGPESCLVGSVLRRDCYGALWIRPSLLVEIAEFEGPRGVPDIFVARIDSERLITRLRGIGYWTFSTRSLVRLRLALETAPRGLTYESLARHYRGSKRSLHSALDMAEPAGVISLTDEVIRLSQNVRRFVCDSVAIEAKVKSAPAALAQARRYRTFSHRVAVLVPNGIRDPATLRAHGVGWLRPTSAEAPWPLRPTRVGPTLREDALLAEEALIAHMRAAIA